MNSNIQKMINELDDTALDQIEQAARAERERRAPKIDINSIRHGMTPEERASVLAAIRKAMPTV